MSQKAPSCRTRLALGIWKKTARVLLPVESTADHADEAADIGDMLEGHLAAQEVARHRTGSFVEELADEPGAPGRCGIEAARHEARVVADPFIVPEPAQQGEELPLAAADLDHTLAVKIMPGDQVAGEAFVEGVEGRGEALRLLIRLRIDRARRLPGCR